MRAPIPRDAAYDLDFAFAREVLNYHKGSTSAFFAEGLGVTKTQFHVGTVGAAAVPVAVSIARADINPWIKLFGIAAVTYGAVKTFDYLEAPRLPANDTTAARGQRFVRSVQVRGSNTARR